MGLSPGVEMILMIRLVVLTQIVTDSRTYCESTYMTAL